MDILMVGAGYAGLLSAVCLASRGHRLFVHDKDKGKISAIARGKAPFFEKGLEPMLEKLVATGSLIPVRSMAEGVKRTSVIFICVGTPQDKDGSADLCHVEEACDELALILKGEAREGSCRRLVVIRSTVPPGTTERLAERISKASGLPCPSGFGIAMNPEFMRQGNAIDDFINTNRVILGIGDGRDENLLRDVYAPFQNPVTVVSIRTAEMSKYVYNCRLGNEISFINEMGRIAKGMDVDIGDVVRALDLRIGMPKATLRSGCGFGGSCIEKDTRALSRAARSLGVEPVMLDASMQVNGALIKTMADSLEKRLGGIRGKRVGVLGLSFKAGTDDLRSSRSLAFIEELLRRDASIVASDPCAGSKARILIPSIQLKDSAEEVIDSSDAIAILTDWPEFASLDFKDRIVVDGRGVVPKERRGKNYEGICWP